MTGSDEYVTKDSGRREDFFTGSRRDTRKGKGRYDLLPPAAIRRLAKVYERGAEKYGDSNWLKGQPLSRFLDSGLRHTMAVLEGQDDEDHAAQAAWNLLAFIEIQERVRRGQLPLELDDLDLIQYPTPDLDELLDEKSGDRLSAACSTKGPLHSCCCKPIGHVGGHEDKGVLWG